MEIYYRMASQIIDEMMNILINGAVTTKKLFGGKKDELEPQFTKHTRAKKKKRNHTTMRKTYCEFLFNFNVRKIL